MHGRVWALVGMVFFVVAGVSCAGDSATNPLEGLALAAQNLLNGEIAGQGIGRFSESNGEPDPGGTSFDFQNAQTVAMGAAGELARIRIPIRNPLGGSDSVTLDIRPLVGFEPDPDDSHNRGSVRVPGISAGVTNANTATWVTFDLTPLHINVTVGEMIAFSVRTTEDVGYVLNPEISNGYPGGGGYRRNRAQTTAWNGATFGGFDYGFQVYVRPQ
jgi:hypothetical protein